MHAPSQPPPGTPTPILRRRGAALTLALVGTTTLSLTSIRPGGAQLADLLFLSAGAVIVVHLLTSSDHLLAPRAARRGSAMIVAGTILLLTAGTVSSLRSWSPGESFGVVLRFAWLTLCWFWILRCVCRDRRDLMSLIRAWKVSAFLTSGAAILGMMGIAFVSTHLGDRQVGWTNHPNHLAAQAAAALPFFILATPQSDHRRGGLRHRIWWLVGIGVCATGLFASGSISGLVAAVCGLAAVAGARVVSRRPDHGARYNPLKAIAVVLVLAIGSVILFTSDLPVVDRLTGYRQGDVYVSESVGYRGNRNAMVTQQFDRFLISGMGLTTSNSARDYLDVTDEAVRNYGVHNMYLVMLHQAGLVAVVGLLLILLTAARQLRLLLRAADAELYPLTLALIGSFASVIAVSMFQPTTFDRFFWMPVAITGCLWAVRRQELAQPGASSSGST